MARGVPPARHRWADGSLRRSALAQIGRPTGQGYILEHARPELPEPLIHRGFNLLQGCLGVL